MLAPTKPVKSCECSGSCGDCCCCTKEAIGLGNVDNTSDLNKPLSRDMVNALSGKVGLDIFTQLKNRVLALENTITEIPDLKVRISECELDIKDHYEAIKRLQSTTKSMADTITELGNRVTGVNDGLVTVGTRVDALETKDSNNVKLSGVNVQTIQGTLKANDPANGATDNTLVTANWVSQTGAGAPNNIIHTNGNETKNGIFFLPNGYEGIMRQHPINTNNTSDNVWRLGFSLTMSNNDILIIKVFSAFNNTDTQEATVKIVKGDGYVGCRIVESSGTTAEMASAKNYVATVDGNEVSFYTLKRRKYTNLYCVTLFYGTYGFIKKLPDIVYANTDSDDPSTETHDLITVGGNVAYHNLE